jgi:2-C-methyl-D-erythritol 2,4-cyclodiphosphate synthase
VEIPHPTGLEGHSDADVLLHAVSDALLGAAALGDIGRHFPDTDPRYQGISSLLLLKHVGDLLAQHRFSVVNVDVTLILQTPKIAPYADQMRSNIASALNVAPGQVSVKATTSEGLGFVGAGEGAAAHAVASIIQH